MCAIHRDRVKELLNERMNDCTRVEQQEQTSLRYLATKSSGQVMVKSKRARNNADPYTALARAHHRDRLR